MESMGTILDFNAGEGLVRIEIFLEGRGRRICKGRLEERGGEGAPTILIYSYPKSNMGAWRTVNALVLFPIKFWHGGP